MKKVNGASLVLLFAFIATSPAGGQNRPDINELLRKKYEIEQQRADAETRRAEAAAAAATARQAQQSNRYRSTAQAQAHIIGEGDPLENTDAPKCGVGSGTTISVSGNFRPSSTTKCDQPMRSEPTDGAEVTE